MDLNLELDNFFNCHHWSINFLRMELTPYEQYSQIESISQNWEKISRSEFQWRYSKSIICCKWYDNKPALLLATNFHGMSGLSNIMRWAKGWWTKAPVSCPNLIMLYNSGMGSVDIINQKTAAYRLNHKSKYCF